MSKLRNFMTEIPSRGIPEKVTRKYLASIGYTSSNDRRIIPVLKFVSLVNDDGTPNENYGKYRDATISKKLMASLVKESYSDLFREYPNADKESTENLSNWFKTHMGVSEKTADFVVGTFRALCDFGDFELIAEEEKEEVKEKEKEIEPKKEVKPKEEIAPGIVINVNIQLALPATENVDVYDKIFKSLKENILTQSS